MFRYAVQFGGMMGVINFILFLLLYIMGFNPLGNASWLGAWIPVLVICISTKSYRENELEGFITYWQAYRTGFLTAVAGGLLSALLIFIFCTIYDNSIVEDFKNQTLTQMEMVETQMKSMLGSNMYEQTIQSYESITTQTVASGEFFNKVLCGIFVSLITAAVYKRDKPFFNPPAN